MLASFGEVPALFDILSVLPATKDYQAMERTAAKYLKDRVKANPLNTWDLCSFFVSHFDD